MMAVGSGLLILLAALAAAVLISERALRLLAAWDIARAFYLENIRAERARWKVLAEETRQRFLQQLEVSDAA